MCTWLGIKSTPCLYNLLVVGRLLNTFVHHFVLLWKNYFSIEKGEHLYLHISSLPYFWVIEWPTWPLDGHKTSPLIFFQQTRVTRSDMIKRLSQKREKNISKLVVWMNIAFLVCWMPYGVVCIIYIIGGEGWVNFCGRGNWFMKYYRM